MGRSIRADRRRTPSPLVADPSPSRVNVHVSLSGAALQSSLDDAVPKTGDGTFSLLGGERPYHWTRGPLELSFGAGRILVKTSVISNVELPISSVDLPFDLQISVEPVINTEYALKLQATDVAVHSDDRRLKLIEQVAGVFGRVSREIDDKLRGFSYELKPLLEESYNRLKEPLDLPMGRRERLRGVARAGGGGGAADSGGRC